MKRCFFGLLIVAIADRGGRACVRAGRWCEQHRHHSGTCD